MASVYLLYAASQVRWLCLLYSKTYLPYYRILRPPSKQEEIAENLEQTSV
jgi:hypothetical protein